jgi:hypothetical protein
MQATRSSKPAPPTRLRHVLYVAPGSLRVATELGPVHRVKGANLPERTAEQERADLEQLDDDQVLDVEDPDARQDGPARCITGFSSRARARMMYRISTLDWTELPGIPEMVTLTYPAEFPTDGPTIKRHLDAFYKRWERRFGAAPKGIWKLEFQRRGAPHFHLYVGRPHMPWRKFLDWARTAWFEVVGSGDAKHLDQGVRLDRQFAAATRSVRKLAGYFAKHNAKHSTKHYQNERPAGFEQVGRWWGRWGMRVHVAEVELDVQSFIEFRRLLVRARRRPTFKPKVPSRLIGTWTLMHDGYATAAQILTWAAALPVGLSPGSRAAVEHRTLASLTP